MKPSANVALLEGWVRNHRQRLVAAGVCVQPVHVSRNPAAAAYIDLEGPGAWARATVWPDMYGDLVVIDAETGAERFNAHFDRVTMRRLEDLTAVTEMANLEASQKRVRALTARIVSSYLQRNYLEADQLVTTIRAVKTALLGHAVEPPVKRRHVIKSRRAPGTSREQYAIVRATAA